MFLAAALLVAILWLPNAVGWTLVAIAFVVEIGEVVYWVRWNKRRDVAHTGGEALPGRTAIVVLDCRPDGQVKFDGELWQATCPEGADRDQKVVVESVDGLTLTVHPSGPGSST